MSLQALEEFKKAEEFTLKEGEPYNIRLTFKVHNDIVFALKMVNVVRKHSIIGTALLSATLAS